jgi:replicative DNA helicase
MILDGKLDPAHVTATSFASPYDEMVKLLAEGKDLPCLYDRVGLLPVKAALEASKTVTDMKPSDAVILLETSYGREELALTLEKQVSRLHKGEDADLLKIEASIAKTNRHEHQFRTMAEIDPTDVVWIPTGYAPIDECIGGIPDASLTIIGASTGVGKTSLLLRLFGCFAKLGKKSLLYTLEMTGGQLVTRMLNVMPGITNEQRGMITVCDEHMNPEEISASAGRIVGLGGVSVIGIDFADLMIEGVEDEPKVASMYRVIATLAKKSGIPVILLSQLSRKYADRGGGEPRIVDLRWSGLAESLAALVLLVYNPNASYAVSGKQSNALPIIGGRAWLIAGKSRYGSSAGGGSPIAIQVGWDGLNGWQEDDFSHKILTSI